MRQGDAQTLQGPFQADGPGAGAVDQDGRRDALVGLGVEPAVPALQRARQVNQSLPAQVLHRVNAARQLRAAHRKHLVLGQPGAQPALPLALPKHDFNGGGGAGLFSAIIGGWANGDVGSQPVTKEVLP